MTDLSTMTDGFDKARAAFVHRAAVALKLADDQLHVMPNTAAEVAVWDMPGRAPGMNPGVGAAWAFEARGPQPAPPVRGWATPAGAVITPAENLGLLLEEAGIWSDDPQASFAELAPRLVWSLGPSHEPADTPAPSLTLADDGSGTAALTSQLVIPGGPTTTVRFILTIRADHSASLAPEAP